MEFRIADTFTDSLARLSGEEQKAVKTAAFDLQMNPAQPGIQFHRIDKSKDRNFWSARVNLDLRIIAHRTDASLLLCYVDHHDEAYGWAERRRLEVHPKTGAAQLVELRETVQEIAIPTYVEAARFSHRKTALFASAPDSELLACGVPPEWIAEVRKVDEDGLLTLAPHLPSEAAEALLDLATGSRPRMPAIPSAGADPFAHPDAQRRFRLMRSADELERALDYPWDKWIVFLHPAQRRLVERDYNGPARVAGSAGTGKTIVALHRAAFLVRKHPESRVLLTTFSEPLAAALRTRLQRLLGNEPRLGERIEVHSLGAAARRLYRANSAGSNPKLAPDATVRDMIAREAEDLPGHKFTPRFLFAEWDEVVDEWQIATWEQYRDVPRLGRKTRLPEAQRSLLWKIFSGVRGRLDAEHLLTEAALFSLAAGRIAAGGLSPFDFVVVDEAQDVGVAQLRFLAALGKNRPDSLFFAGDLGQRIFRPPFSWKALGVDVRGRSTTLKINYRTSHQIRAQADRLLGSSLHDLDGNVEERRGTTSVFSGPPPEIGRRPDAAKEAEFVSGWLTARTNGDAIQPHEIGVFVRSAAQMDRAIDAVALAGLKSKVLDKNVEIACGTVSIATMHLAKGLEFRAVAVMACDDEVIPLQERIENASDDSELEEIYTTERHLLYVACTRAREHLLISGAEPVSEFVDDLRE
jgi:hypothetical protein